MRKPSLILTGIAYSLAAGLAWAQDALQQNGLGAVMQDYEQFGDSRNMISLAAGLLPGGGGGSGFSWVAVVSGLIFSSIGFIGFIHGKKNRLWRPTIVGIALMVYPYFFASTVAVIMVGIALTAALYYWRNS